MTESNKFNFHRAMICLEAIDLAITPENPDVRKALHAAAEAFRMVHQLAIGRGPVSIPAQGVFAKHAIKLNPDINPAPLARFDTTS